MSGFHDDEQNAVDTGVDVLRGESPEEQEKARRIEIWTRSRAYWLGCLTTDHSAYTGARLEAELIRSAECLTRAIQELEAAEKLEEKEEGVYVL